MNQIDQNSLASMSDEDLAELGLAREQVECWDSDQREAAARDRA
jgi:hypothetical protein